MPRGSRLLARMRSFVQVRRSSFSEAGAGGDDVLAVVENQQGAGGRGENW